MRLFPKSSPLHPETLNPWLVVLICFGMTLLMGFSTFLANLVIKDKQVIRFSVTATLICSILSVFAAFFALLRKQQDPIFEAEIKTAERKFLNQTNQTAAAWELGRIKLESYLNRNLSQVSAIFFLTVGVMIVGFFIIGYGIWRLYSGDKSLDPAILTTVTGLVVELIAGSFLLVYKSTIQQAKKYVTVLERINAVGMSVQILDSISSNSEVLQDQTKADIAKQLLAIYGNLSIEK